MKNGIVPEYVRYYLIAAKDYAETLASGTTFKELSGSRMAQILVPIAPLEDQRRIVAKLDVLLQRSNGAREELAHIPNLVERHKEAILATAFDGSLTTEWRGSNDQCQDCWPETTLGRLAIDVRYGTATKCYYEPQRTPVLRIPNVVGGGVDTSDLKYGSFSEGEIEKLALQQGDLLVIRSNGSLDLVGRAAMVPESVEGFLFAGYLIRIRVDTTLVRPQFVRHAFNEPGIRAHIETLAKSTSGVNNINSEQLRNIRLRVPPLAEQDAILDRITEAFAAVDAANDEANRAAKLLERLDQRTLEKAFEGELVI